MRTNILPPAAAAASASAPASSALIAQANQMQKDLANAKAHQDALTEQHALTLAIAQLQPTWSPLPLGPYPPATDNTGFPRTGDPSLIVSASSVTADQLQEPIRAAQGLSDQASARRPQLSGMFWLGLTCLGVGIYVYKKR
jgi:hypothetical protein